MASSISPCEAQGQQPVQEIRVMLVTEKQEWHDAIYGYLTSNPRYHIVLLGWYTRLPLLMAALRSYRPEVVLVDYDTPGLSSRAVESIYAAVGATCLGLIPRGSSSADAAMRDMGCVDSHCPPFDTDELVLKVQMAQVKAEQLASAAKAPMSREVRDQVQVIKDRIIAFYSRAGGVGKSTMARETAATLALIGHHPTVLVDFCATGSIQFRLFPFTDQDRRHNLFRLCLNASVEMEDPALNELIRHNLLIYRRHGNHEGDLNLLFAPPLDEQWIDESLRHPRLFARILELLARLYTFVVVDIGQDLNLPSHAAALMKADLVALVTTPSPQTVEMLAEGLPDLARLVEGGRKLRNVAIKLRRVHLKPCMAEAKAIFNAPSRRESIKRFRAWKDKWEVEEERAVRCLEKDLHHCLHYYPFPKEWWKKIRTTNILEREFREVRRRTRPMGFFPHEESAQRIFYGVTSGIHQNGYHPIAIKSAESLT